MPVLPLRVVSTAINIPGPVAAALLRDMGASIAKVEPPTGDPLEQLSPGWYGDLVRGIDVMRLDLKTPDGRERLDVLLTDADLLITATRPAALARIGLDWPALHARHPRLCVVSIVGYPAPRQDVAGHDLTYQAEEGLVTPPALPRTFISDLSGAQRTVIAALALVLARQQNGEADRIEISLSESARFFAEPLAREITTDHGILGGALATYHVYEAREGWVAVAALEPHFAERLQQALGIDVRQRHVLAFALLERTAEEWQAWAEARDLPIVALRERPPLDPR